MAKLNGRDILLIGCLLGGSTSSDVQMYATKVESEGDECPDTLSPDTVYFTIPVATIEGQREPKVGDYLVYDHNVANTSGCKQILCEITELDDRGEPYRYGVNMRAICFMPVVEESGGGSNKLALVMGTQDAKNNPYEITAEDLEGVTEIVKEGFIYRAGLTRVSLPTTCTKIGEYGFDYCTSLTSVDMTSVKSVGNYGFTSCTSLTLVNMSSIETLAVAVFNACSALVSLTIPATCTRIDKQALNCGSSTKKCTFTFLGTTPPTITTTTFSKSYINKIIVPVGCGETYKTATNWTALADYIEEMAE